MTAWCIAGIAISTATSIATLFVLALLAVAAWTIIFDK